MNEQVVFFQLTHKFVRQQGPDEPPPLEQSSPAMAEAARQVIYYSLAIGHHVGVMDCFQQLLALPLESYRQLLETLPDGTARQKLEGLLRWGEIEINSSHAPDMLAALQQTRPVLSTDLLAAVDCLIQALQRMQREPVYYLMGRKYANGTPQHFLSGEIEKMSQKLLFTIGNSLQGDDALGALLAEKLQRHPLPDWSVLHGGSTPENYLHLIRLRKPEQVLVVDAADMDLPPGSIRLIDDRHLDDPFLMTTHNIPLSYTIRHLREFVKRVDLLGVQPEVVAFGYPVSPAIQQAVEEIYQALEADRWDWQTLEEKTEKGVE